MRRPAGMESLGPGSLRQVFHAAGGLAARDAQGVDEVVALQPQQPPGNHRSAESPAGAGGMEASPVMLGRLQCAAQPHDDVVPRNHCGDEVLARHLGQVGHRKGGGKGHHTRMQRRLVVYVVHLYAVKGDAVGHRSVLRQHSIGRTDDHRRPGAVQPLQRINDSVRRAGGGAVERNCGEVQAQVFGPVDHFRRQILVLKRLREAA